MKILQSIFLILILISNSLAEVYGNALVKKVERVYDGDTIVVDLHDLPAIVGEDISIRINNIDTPEIRSHNKQLRKLAYQARDFLKEKVANSKIIELRNIKRGKYFRLVADVYLDEINIGEMMVSAGHAVLYDGGKRPNWEKIIKTAK